MLVINWTDFPDTQKPENYFWLSDLFASQIPRKVLEIFFQGTYENIDEILRIISNVLQKEELNAKDFELLHQTVLNPRFYKFYKTQIVFKQGVSGILTDASAPYSAQKIQSVLDGIISKDAYLLNNIQASKIQHMMQERAIGEEVLMDGKYYIRLIYQKKQKIYQREKKSHNCMLLREVWDTRKKIVYHTTLWCIECSFPQINMNLSDFWDFFIGEWYAVHTVSWVAIYFSDSWEVIEGGRGYSAVIDKEYKKATLFSSSWHIVRKIDGWTFNEYLVSYARSKRKRETASFVQKIQYNKDTGKLEVYSARYSLFRESDFSDDWQKENFRSVRRSVQREQIGMTYSIFSSGVPEEILL